MVKTGNNISRLRKAKGLTIKEIQETMGFNTPQAIYKWQNGASLPSLENLIVLADLLDTDISNILVIEK